MTRPRAQRRHLPPAIHTDEAHRAISTELVRLTLQTSGGARMPYAVQLALLIATVACGTAYAVALITAVLRVWSA